MIDLLSLDINIKHEPFGNQRIKKDLKTGETTVKHFSDKVELYADAADICVTSLDDGNRINIRCSPLKPFQGHNVFGTSNVLGLGFNLIGFSLEHLGIKASAAQIQAWREGHYQLREIHVTYRLRLPSHDLLKPLVTHILRTIDTKYRPAMIKTGVGIELHSPDSHADWMLYDKLLYLEDKRHHELKHVQALVQDEKTADEIWALLLKAATNSLRMELRLDKDYLKNKRNKLDTAAAWVNKHMVKEVFLRELGLLRLGRVPRLESVLPLLEQLRDNPPLCRTFRLWLMGDDLSLYCSSGTINSHRKAILKRTGIDISRDRPPAKMPTFDLANLFEPEKIDLDFPDWIDAYPQAGYKGSDLAHLRRKSRPRPVRTAA